MADFDSFTIDRRQNIVKFDMDKIERRFPEYDSAKEILTAALDSLEESSENDSNGGKYAADSRFYKRGYQGEGE